ncbi:hypothetical protein PspLS_08911 [Pyricularia sp. CBS 133598]|nr:hypothetical protein PspLS_08911 [Pyricularia sp. CBS 133598]
MTPTSIRRFSSSSPLMELFSLATSIETSARAPYLSVYGATDKDPNPRAHSNIPINSGVYPSPKTAEMEMSPVSNGSNGGHSASASPQPEPKNVRFELVSSESPQHRARLPMRVQIYPHDATESIVTTVKNFYGLYSSPTSSKGVSFEDEAGNTMIARYENFRNNMVVYVRVIEEPTASAGSFGAHSYHHPNAVGAQMYFSPDAYGSQAGSHVQQLEAHLSRPASRTSRRRSPSPNIGRSARSTSVGTNNSGAPKSRSRSTKYRGDGGESHNGYSSGDGAPGSNSGRNKDQIGNTEISVENIVEGGRRKRAKFESSELPLFAPPQMPAATSNPSVSPARRVEHHRASLPFVHPGQNPFTNPRPLQSPQSNGNGFGHPGAFVTPSAESRRTRGSVGYPSGNGVGPSAGILPTPDPTVGSCMSEEDKDVAIQLMRLGEISNISHGRTSASTLDDTFSGRADAASSAGATSDADSESEDEQPPARRQKLDVGGASKSIHPSTESHLVGPQNGFEMQGHTGGFHHGTNEGLMGAPRTKPNTNMLQQNGTKPKTMPAPSAKPKAPKAIKTSKSSNSTKNKKSTTNAHNGPMSPASLPASRKPSIASNGSVLGMGDDDQPDLSSKPRCQRCRKSKKGCDRQRPCGRCKDAGIPAELCISEDEGNGRKGRYGRHMGVPIKTDEAPAPQQPQLFQHQQTLLPAAPIAPAILPPISAMPLDKNKKRKR